MEDIWLTNLLHEEYFQQIFMPLYIYKSGFVCGRMNKDRSIDEFKKEYEKYRVKYKLPNFMELNRDFEIERAYERETDFPLREIRKLMMDKVLGYLRFIELLLNPTNAPLFFFGLVKGMGMDDRKTIEKIYGKLGEFEIDVIELDNDYTDEKEARFIANIYKGWQEIKSDLKGVIGSLRSGWNQKNERKDKGYMG